MFPVEPQNSNILQLATIFLLCQTPQRHQLNASLDEAIRLDDNVVCENGWFRENGIVTKVYGVVYVWGKSPGDLRCEICHDSLGVSVKTTRGLIGSFCHKQHVAKTGAGVIR
jgi:hypothetical protein